ncbi:MAG: oligosaccharide flippase family protein [Pseudomonadota bacterium]
MIAKLKVLVSGNGHEAEVLRGAAIALVLRGLSGALVFALNVVIARALGAQGAGVYFFSLSVVTILSVVTRIGFDNALLRFVSSAASVGDWARVRGVYRIGMRMAVMASFAVSLLLAGAAPFLVGLLGKSAELVSTLMIMAPSVLGLAVMFLGAESLKGLKRVAPAVTVSSLIYPLVAMLLVWPLAQRFGPAGVAGAYSLGVGIAALAGYVLWRRYTAPYADAEPLFDRAELMQSARPLWVMSLITRAVFAWSPLLILGFFAPAEDVGVYGAATRIAALVTLLLLSVNTVISPKFSELYTKGDLETMGQVARQFSFWLTAATGPLILALVLAGDYVMAIFGEEFMRGGRALSILAMGQAANAMTGSAGSLLMMTGHERDLRNASVLGGLLLLALSAALIPLFGFLGAAIATAVSIAAMSLANVALIRRRLGIRILPWEGKV